ncbi:hypothetical protein INT48_005007 [Thamnidium elegans]|uniref:Uncharacterized protein n=1 Tax=Thamnidium elegans TaxID=101142 RepID=A0A8H7VZR9_9FUNG|nr:hypothetical protein INT48_005007 [Thamnidium elegans]
MEGILDRFGRKKYKRPNGTIPPTKYTGRRYSVRRILSIRPKSRILTASAIRQQSIIPNSSSFEAGSAEHLFAREQYIPSDHDVNALFDNMLERRGIHDRKIKQSMEHWEKEKKWLMIHQDHQAELLASGVSQGHMQETIAERASLDMNRLPNTQLHDLNTISPLSPNRYQQSLPGPFPETSTSSPVHTTPSNNHSTATFSNNISTSNIMHPISTTLRKSRSIANLSPVKAKNSNNDHGLDDSNSPEYFVRKFLSPNLRSVTPKIAESLELGNEIYSPKRISYNRRDVALELEVEIVKCIKAIVNTRIGGKEAMDHPEYIHAVVFSIHCPQWQTRKIVCELLAFICYLDGHEHVVRGFELLKKFKKSLVLYDSWMKEFLRTIDTGHDKMKSEKIPENFNLLNIQINLFKELAEHDIEDAFGEELNLETEFAEPSKLFDRVLANISDSSRGTEYLINILKYFLWIKGDAETKAQFYHMISIIVQQIVMDRRPHCNSDDFSSTFGMSVATVFKNFYDVDRLRNIERESNDLREMYEQVLQEKNELQTEVQQLRILPNQIEHESQKQRIVYLKQENDSLRDVLKTSKETIAMLQDRLAVAENTDRRRSSLLILTEDWKVSAKARISMDEMYSSSKESEPQLISGNVKPINESNSFGFGNILPFFSKKHKKPRPIVTSASFGQIHQSLDYTQSPSSFSDDSSVRSESKPTAITNAVTAAPVLIVPLRKQIQHYPQVKLKNFQWKKMDANAAENTIWNMDIGEDDGFMQDALKKQGAFEKIEALFPAKVNTFLEKRLAQTNNNTVVKNDSVKFLSKDKNRNINIVIFPKIKHFSSYKEVRDHILAMDDKLCTETFLSNLIAYCPSREDDLITMQKYISGPEEDCQKLDLPEQFTIEMMRIYRYETRIKFMLFRLQYWEKFEHLRKSLSIVLETSDSLRNSKALKKLLQLILVLGNYMNSSGQQGGAFGMKIDSINKLADTKASDESHLTLLHCLVGIVRRHFSFILDFIDDLKDVNQASRVMVSINDIGQQYIEMRQGLKQIGMELELYWPSLEELKEKRSVSPIEEEEESQNQKAEGTFDNGSIRSHTTNERNEMKLNDTGSIRSRATNQSNEIESINTSQNNNYAKSNYDTQPSKDTDTQSNHIFDHIDTFSQEETMSLNEPSRYVTINRDRFSQVMEEFRNSANNRFEELEALYVNVDFKWRDIMVYYGESPKLMRPDEFFQIFSRFITSWKQAAKEELKYSEDMEREERRKQALEEKRKALTKPSIELSDSDSQSSRTSGEDHDRRIMDDLMEQLRSGKTENKMRQRRVRERLRKIKNEEEMIKPSTEKNRAATLSVAISRTDSTHSSISSGQIPVISAEDLLRSLQQENE